VRFALRLVARGRTNREIAAELLVSEATRDGPLEEVQSGERPTKALIQARDAEMAVAQTASGPDLVAHLYRSGSPPQSVHASRTTVASITSTTRRSPPAGRRGPCHRKGVGLS
jgi:hypothetical protein